MAIVAGLVVAVGLVVVIKGGGTMDDEDDKDGLNGARGVALGAVLGLVLWAMLFTIGLEVWYLLERWGVRP